MLAAVWALLFAWAVPASAASIDVQLIRPPPNTYASLSRLIEVAELGDAKAQARLGWMYLMGRDVPQHNQLAARWYRLSAAQGYGPAQFALGLLYNRGRGVPQDLVLSYIWLNLAAAQARGEDRDFKVRIREAVASKMTVDQLEMAQQMTVDFHAGR
ncbi:MAG: uncharacterized protein QOD74_2727 [Variibacter sp.]|nr:uncharacterized protein [Variibacter sp.]